MTTFDARQGASTAGRFAAALVPVVLLLFAARWAVTPDPTLRNYEYFPDMALSLAVESHTLAASLPGGLGDQPLVPGVVVRGSQPFGYAAGDEEAKRAGRELRNPFARDDKATLARGQALFRSHCVHCHDAQGDGQGLAVQRGMVPPPPFKGANAMQMADGEMFHLLTLGRGNMPGLSRQLTPSDRWSAVLAVRALQEAKK